MIWTVCKISILRLGNNVQELLLLFAVPVMFFSIFALIFSRGVGQSVSRVAVCFIDDDRTEESSAIIEAASKHDEIHPKTSVGRTSDRWPIDELSRLLISKHNIEVVVYIPQGFTTQDPDAPNLSVQLYNEGINPIGHRLVQASLAEAIAMQLAEMNLAEVEESMSDDDFSKTQDTQKIAIQQASFQTPSDSKIARQFACS